MDKRSITDGYQLRAEQLSTEIAALRRRNRAFVAGELTTFGLALACLVVRASWVSSNWMWVVALAFVVAYVLVRQMDSRNSDKIEWLGSLFSVYQKELKYMQGDLSPFDNGQRYADASHPFSFDLDVFGRDSLFQRINRTVTTGGSDWLARQLSCQRTDSNDGNIEYIRRRREAIATLSDKTTMRADFMAHGQKGLIDSVAVREALQQTRNVSVSTFASSGVGMGLAVLALVALWAVVVLSIIGLIPAGVAVTWACVQLMAVLMCTSRSLRNIHNAFNRLNKQVGAYLELVRIIARNIDNRHVKIDDPDLPQLDYEHAEKPFAELKRILDGLDRRGNVLGLVIFDIFLLSDFFLLGRFLRWQRMDMDAIAAWVEAIAVYDGLISMATFRYNEPSATDAEMVDSDDVVFEAQGLWHPFLGERAVRNDFTVEDSHYYIITGANMAGKSTFLRSVGINILLAYNGLPVFAEHLRVSVFSLFTSMRTTDDLSRGISYFNAELLRLKQLLGSCRHQRRTLIILDEILKGTNSLDKLNGSRLFLQEIARWPVSGIVATHDLELSKMEDEQPERFHNYCFEISLSDKITYTYKMSRGVARNQNATYLLRGILEDPS